MKISYNWLKEYIDTELEPRKIAEILTNIGLEVTGMEFFESVRGGLDGVVIGEVVECVKHPNADKLTLATVDIGSGKNLKIVCGAPNVAAGQKVPVAPVGTTLYMGEENVVIKKSRIRGEESEGMICAEDELGLGSDHTGIMILDPAVKTGTPASSYFNVEKDTVFEIDLTPNRIDAASHIGVARDLAAFLKKSGNVRLKRPSVEDFRIDDHDLTIDISVENTDGCIRYTGITITGVTVTDSPDWLQSRLRTIGLMPINNIVDITNFVLHEVGQPLHAFDADKITGNRVIVKTLPAGTSFTTLDEKKRVLLDSDLMICNSEEGMCIAGVFGGISSGVTAATKSVFLESACFDPVFIRRSSKHHMLYTDASFRFERGTDPNITVWALKRAIILMKEIAGGNVSSDIIDVYPHPVNDFEIDIRFANINRLVGKVIDPSTIRDILESLDIRVVTMDEKGMKLAVPPYRVDVQREADIIEEILRIYGFNNIEIHDQVLSTLSYSVKPDKEKLINQVSDLLSSNGFYEIKSNSLTKESYYRVNGQDNPETVRICNPLSQDLSRMRMNLLFGGLEAISYNINRQNPDLRFYEFGYCYFTDPAVKSRNPLDKYREEHQLGIFITGKRHRSNWIEKSAESSFYLLKSFVELVLRKSGIDTLAISVEPVYSDHYSEGLSCRINDLFLLRYGKVSDSLCHSFDIGQDVFAAEMNWDHVMKLSAAHTITFKSITKYPAVTRDLSMILNREVTYAQLQELAFKTEKELLKQVWLFDVYEGDKIEKGKKSYALSFILQDENNTLTDERIDKSMNNIASKFEKLLGARIRGA